MPDQYETLVKSHDQLEKVIEFYRDHVEYPTFLSAVGPATGESVLDVGCGEGAFTRKLSLHGVSHVVGVDRSEGMIQRARDIEVRQPLGIDYEIHDLTTMPVLGSFDMVTAAHVLHYADDWESLVAMAKRMYANLAPGGRLITLVTNTDSSARSEEAAGFRTHRPIHPREADSYPISILTNPPTDFHVRYWPRARMERAFELAGFGEVASVTLRVSPDTAAEDLERARLCAENPIGLLLTARK
jgi:ubiquinone/menaquinone biosynthesis C-methylase UbiE